MKGDITLKILEFIGESTMNALDLTAAFLNAGYGASYGKIQYEFSKIKQKRTGVRDGIENVSRERQRRKRFIDMLYSLKKDGLVKEISRNSGLYLRLTVKGELRLRTLKERTKIMLPEPTYEKSRHNKFTIVTFDIPESERRKRDWLRSVLKNLGFRFIQKSVFMGKIKIPKDFLNDVDRLGLTSFVEIFEISKTGTLKHLI